MKGALRDGDGFAGRGDDAYAALMQAHDGLPDAESAALNARLVLILANEVGDLDRLRAAIALALRAGGPQDDESGT